MKIALYTIFRCTNYGAVLQALALTSILRRYYGADSVDVINHLMDPRDNHLLGKITNAATPWYQRWINRRKFLRRYYGVEFVELRRRKTLRLIDMFIRPTDRLYRDPKEFASLPSYNTVIVGSDQIWNPVLNMDFGYNPYLMTTFPENQDRVAYAASFGLSELPESADEEYRDAISRFRVITCREESGADICNKLLCKRPEVVLDPTLLLSAAMWHEFSVDREKHLPQKAVAAYWVRPVITADLMALSGVARKFATRVRLMCAGYISRMPIPPEIDLVLDADPLDFVAEIASSRCVVTDSFHGLQFAALFHKPFAAVADLNAESSAASRLIDFVKRYGLLNGISDIDDFREGADIVFESYDSFSEVDLDNDRSRSLHLLKDMLE